MSESWSHERVISALEAHGAQMLDMGGAGFGITYLGHTVISHIAKEGGQSSYKIINNDTLSFVRFAKTASGSYVEDGTWADVIESFNFERKRFLPIGE